MPDKPNALFDDEELRNDWLTCLKFLRDDEVVTMTYRGWLGVVRDTAFDVLVEELEEVSWEQAAWQLANYIERVNQIRSELMFMNRNGL
jgi:hypothetical protein